MNDTVNQPLLQNDVPQDTQPPAPRRGSRSAKWSRNFGFAAWILPLILYLSILGMSHFRIRSWSFLIAIAFSIPLSAILAVILGHISNWRSRHPTKSQRHDRAIIGLALGYLMLTVVVCGALFLARVRVEAPFASCQNNLKVMGICFRMYVTENREFLFPELSPVPGMLAISNISGSPLYPKYLTDPARLFCVEKRGREEYEKWGENSDVQEFLNHSSYIYLGYAVESEAEVEVFAEAYRQRIAQGLPFNEDLTVPLGKGNGVSDTIHRLREGVERYLITDIGNPAASAMAQSEIPVLIERLGNHEHEGGNVLYLDGHVEFHRYPGDWPMTEKTMTILQSLDEMKK